MAAAFFSVVPLIPAGADLRKALAFYTQQLGFSIVRQDESMAGIQRDEVAFNLVQNDNEEWTRNASFSIGVSDLNALFQEYQHIPARVGALEIKSWGRREFHLIVPSGPCLQFYEKS
jgi:catechol 2,3-dioxygenase-like lactoylglutathione lyase family enzyme